MEIEIDESKNWAAATKLVQMPIPDFYVGHIFLINQEPTLLNSVRKLKYGGKTKNKNGLLLPLLPVVVDAMRRRKRRERSIMSLLLLCFFVIVVVISKSGCDFLLDHNSSI